MNREAEQAVKEKTSDFIARATEHAERIKDRTTEIAEQAAVRSGEKWQESEPIRKRVGEKLGEAVGAVTAFGVEVTEGFKEGVARARRVANADKNDVIERE